MKKLQRIYCRSAQTAVRLLRTGRRKGKCPVADSPETLLTLLNGWAATAVVVAAEPLLLEQGLVEPVLGALESAGYGVQVWTLTADDETHAASLYACAAQNGAQAIVLVGEAMAKRCAVSLKVSAYQGCPAVCRMPALPMTQELACHGLGTLCTAVEAFLSAGASHEVRELSAEAVALVIRHLRLAHVNPLDPEAHRALQRALYCVHKADAEAHAGYVAGIAQVLEAKTGALAVQAKAMALLPVLEEFERHEACRRRLARLAHAASLTSEGAGVDVAVSSLMLWLRESIALLGLEGRAALSRAEVPQLAAEIAALCNPSRDVPVELDRFELERILLSLMAHPAQEREIARLVQNQRDYFRTGATLPLAARADALTRLHDMIRRREDEIHQALRADLGKCAEEAYLCETGMVLAELTHMRRHFRRYAARRDVPTPLHQFAARSCTLRRPYGVALIMSPWNYPFLLTMSPLIGAIAAGNCCVVKPSAYAPQTSAVIRGIIADCFPQEHCAVVEGGRVENQALLDQRFDRIFFTGGETVGREVLRRAAEHLTPVTLELGGKSPVVVTESAKIPLAAKRIAFGKLLNAGQTCVAPDYVLVQRSVKAELTDELRRCFAQMALDNPLANEDYVHMINERHYDRVMGLIDPKKVVCGGEGDPETLRIQPTILDGVTPQDLVMQEEIFGPLLPMIEYDSLDEAINFICDRPTPLACYLFTEDKAQKKEFLARVPFGGGCINDTIIHLASSRLPFGGLGASGMGRYHGRYSFDAFSHTAGVVDKATWLDLPMRYAPYDQRMMKLIRFFLK